jgi:hypothetical protein
MERVSILQKEFFKSLRTILCHCSDLRLVDVAVLQRLGGRDVECKKCSPQLSVELGLSVVILHLLQGV